MESRKAVQEPLAKVQGTVSSSAFDRLAPPEAIDGSDGETEIVVC